MSSTIKQRIVDIQRGNVPAGYRKTKCGIIPDTWSCCQPKEIFSGKSIKNNDSELPVLSVTQENGVMLRSEMDKDISYKEDSVSSYKRVDIGDFVISLRSFEGGIEYSQCQGVVSPAYTIFSHSEDVDGNYYKYYFKTDSFINKLNTAVYGIRDGKQIGFQDFSNLFIHCPPLEEQRRIAEILGCCDRVIALKKELIAEKKKQKKSLMQKLLNPDSGFRLPGFSGERKIKTYAEIFDKIPVKKYQISSNEYRKQGLYPIIDQGQEIVVAYSDDPTHVFHCPMQGVIIFGDHTRELKYASFDFIIGADGTQVFTTIRENCLYMFYFCKMINIPNLGYNRHFSYIKSASFAVHSSLLEQQAIADILSAADKEIDLLEQELAQQEQKKKSLMQLLLNGIVRV